MSRARALIHVSLAYFIALIVMAATVYGLARAGQDSLLVQLGVADLLGTLVIFGFSVRWNNSSLYDPYWSVLPIGLAAYLAQVGWGSGADPIRVIVVLGLVGWWGARLTHNWARGWPGMEHEDWRYVDFRARTGSLYWLVSLVGIHLFPTLMVFLGCLPLVVIMSSSNAPLGWLDGLAIATMVAGILLEQVADNQLRDYVLHRKKPGETMTEGIWGWSRHPNYCGEMLFWLGLFGFGLAAGGREWWLGVGALAIVVMFNLVSIPLIEKRMLARRHDYARVQARVSRIVPWFPKR